MAIVSNPFTGEPNRTCSPSIAYTAKQRERMKRLGLTPEQYEDRLARARARNKIRKTKDGVPAAPSPAPSRRSLTKREMQHLTDSRKIGKTIADVATENGYTYDEWIAGLQGASTKAAPLPRKMDLSKTNVKLTEAERKSASLYTQGYNEDGNPIYGNLNGRLRRGKELSLEELQIAEDLDKAIARSSSSEPFTVWRGIDIENLPQGLQPGSILTDEGFMSTSLDRDVVEDFIGGGSRSAILKIEVPAGKGQALILGEGFNGPGFMEQAEVILARGSSVSVRRIYTDAGGETIIEAVLL